MSANDARRTAREVLDRYIPVTDTASGAVLGYLADISVQGIMLQSVEPLVLGEHQEGIRLEIGDDDGMYPRLTVECRPVWSRKQDDSVFYNTGLEFVELDEADQPQVRALMDEFGLR